MSPMDLSLTESLSDTGSLFGKDAAANPLKSTAFKWLSDSTGLTFDETNLIVGVILMLLVYFIVSWIIKLAIAIIWPMSCIAVVAILAPTITSGPADTWIPEFIRIGRGVFVRLNIIWWNVVDIAMQVAGR